MWGRGVDHSWYAEEESVVLTVRWPSVPGYAVADGADPGAPGRWELRVHSTAPDAP
ncbi:hypothetical protein SVIOM342S_04457 [Streptomyces violaceorubidus]